MHRQQTGESGEGKYELININSDLALLTHCTFEPSTLKTKSSEQVYIVRYLYTPIAGRGVGELMVVAESLIAPPADME